jgi:aminoglycoside phosphotransferase (APT) family kinase protein
MQVAGNVKSQRDGLRALVLSAGGGQNVVVDVNAIRAIWADALSAPQWKGPRMWLHGDLHPANVLTSNGNLCGVVATRVRELFQVLRRHSTIPLL